MPRAWKARSRRCRFTLLEWDDATAGTLHALGLATIGDLLALPRASFARRFGRERLDDLDRLLARRADPQPMYAPPERFAATIELPADVTDTAQLMFPAQRLLASLEGFLRGRGAGTTELHFTVTHDPRRAQPQPPTEHHAEAGRPRTRRQAPRRAARRAPDARGAAGTRDRAGARRRAVCSLSPR